MVFSRLPLKKAIYPLPNENEQFIDGINIVHGWVILWSSGTPKRRRTCIGYRYSHIRTHEVSEL